LIFLTYDSERDQQLRHFIMHCPPGEYELTGSDANFTYIKRDGTSETR
jgi:hypothetical protein